MRVAALFSGGKDSNYALFCAQHYGWDVECLVSVFSTSPESYMYHVPAIELTRLAAESIGLPLVEVVTPPEPEAELLPLKEALRASAWTASYPVRWPPSTSAAGSTRYARISASNPSLLSGISLRETTSTKWSMRGSRS